MLSEREIYFVGKMNGSEGVFRLLVTGIINNRIFLVLLKMILLFCNLIKQNTNIINVITIQ